MKKRTKQRPTAQQAVDNNKEPVAALPAERSARSAAIREKKPPALFALFCLTTLGVVFGDIGTSPLYAIRQCFRNSNPQLAPAPPNVLGLLSLITWSLLIIISIKYLFYVMTADNKGEGGILALLALFNRRVGQRFWFSALGIFGAALLYGDGIITPAISVLSAVEGLAVATPIFKPFIVPIAIAILVLLFLLQRHGSGKLGLVLGPIMLIWFVVIALLGLVAIWQKPAVLAGFNPAYAVAFLFHNGWIGFVILGAVFLVVTGGEALYADLGHFGAGPIRATWFFVVLPALLLNYFGQGAFILARGAHVNHPFFDLAPGWALYPLVILATFAAVIASQAIISGIFSLTRQAVLMEEFPRVRILQTSAAEIGQIYVPLINWLLMLACVSLVLFLPSSDRLAGAYGVAVSATMIITTILLTSIARQIWKWNYFVVLLITVILLAIDLSFFSANLLKFLDGGWFPILIGAIIFLIMTTWKRGHTLLHQRLLATTESFEDVLGAIGNKKPQRVPGISVFLTQRSRGAPPVLMHYMKHSHSLTERVIILHVATADLPHIPSKERAQCEKLPHDLFRVKMKFGFLDLPDVPAVLRELEIGGERIKVDEITYFVAHGVVRGQERNPGMVTWRRAIFAFLLRNTAHAIEFFHIPPRQVVELGLEIAI